MGESAKDSKFSIYMILRFGLLCAFAIILVVIVGKGFVKEEEEPENLADQVPTFTSYEYYGDLLTGPARLFYEALEEAEQKGLFLTGDRLALTDEYGLKIKISLLVSGWSTTGAFGVALNAFYGDHPELFYVDFTKVELQEVELSSGWMYVISSAHLPQFETEDDIYAAQIKLGKAVDDYLRGTEESAPDEIVYGVNDKLIHECKYMAVSDSSNTNGNLPRTAYGALVNGEAQCMGFSAAAKLILDQAGINTIMVTGQFRDAINRHAWNNVQINDEWYLLDVTFNQGNGVYTKDYLLVGQKGGQYHNQDEYMWGDGVVNGGNGNSEYFPAPTLAEKGFYQAAEEAEVDPPEEMETASKLPTEQTGRKMPVWVWALIAIAVLAAIGLGVVLVIRKRQDEDDDDWDDDDDDDDEETE